MTMSEIGPEVTLAQLLQSVRVPWSQGGAFILALSYTCEQYGFVNLALVLRDTALTIVDQPPA